MWKQTTHLHRFHISCGNLTPLVGRFLEDYRETVVEERDDASGWSLRDLWEQVANRSELSLELRNGLYERLMRALGRDWGDANRYRFDPNTAHEHMKLYDADDIPRVSPELPPEVSRVRFESELSGVPTVSKQDPDLRIGLFGEMFG